MSIRYFTIICSLFIAPTIFGFFFYNDKAILPNTAIFEVVFFAVFLLSKPKLHNSNLLMVFFLSFFVFLKGYINIAFYNVNVFDFLLAHKFAFYLILLAMAGVGSIQVGKDFIIFFRIILVAFFIKYFVCIAFGLYHRPMLYVENNFELMLLLLFSILKHDKIESINKFELGLIISVIFLSGSRSGLLCGFACLLIYQYRATVKKTFITIILAVICSIPIISFFISRMSSVELMSIDRFVFLMRFIEAMSLKDNFNIAFGDFILQDLPPNICSSFSYYASLFSYKDSNICYSNVFHSFIMRLVYDFGLLGVVATFITLISIFRRNISNKAVLCIVSLVVLNGISVSSINSVYFAIGLIFILVLSKRETRN